MAREWTVTDKRNLLLALQKYGATDLEAIQVDLPEKSINEIRSIIEVYTKRAHLKQKGFDNVHEDDVPLNVWIELILKSDTSKNSLSDLLARVLKYIALFEKRTPSDVNLSDCYMALSDMAKGVPPREMDEKTTYFFYQCLVKLATSIQNKNIDAEKEFIKNMKLLECGQQSGTTYSRKKLSKNVNPLDIPGHLLKKDIEDTVQID